MSRPNLLTLLLILGAGLSACQPAPPADLSQTDVAAINAVLDVLPTEFKKKNAEGVAAVFASDAVLLEDGRIDRGKDAILNDHIKPEAAAMSVVKFQSNDRVIQGRGGMAYTFERYAVEANDATGKPLYQADSAWYSAVLEKQADGSWKTLLGHWSSPAPPAPVQPARPTRRAR